MKQTGSKGSADLLNRELFGQAVFESLEPQIRIRMLGNIDPFFSVERWPLSFKLNLKKIVDLKTPVMVAVSEERVRNPNDFSSTRHQNGFLATLNPIYISFQVLMENV